jgi:hypothetical protein
MLLEAVSVAKVNTLGAIVFGVLKAWAVKAPNLSKKKKKSEK